MNPEMLLAFLRDNGAIDETQYFDLLEEQERAGKPIEEVIANSGVMKLADMYQLVANSLGTEVVDPTNMEFPHTLLSIIPPQTARLQGVLPLDYDGTTLRVAVINPLDPNVVDNLRFTVQKEIAIYVAPATQIQSIIEKFYGTDVSDMEEVLKTLAGDAAHNLADTGKNDLDAASSAPIVNYVNTVLAQAIQARASDIHFEPFEYDFKIRYRVDGALYEMAPPPRSLASAVTSRIKVMSQMNIAERRIPQDGRIQTTMSGRQVDLRVSTLPTQFGESVVLRVLDRSSVKLDLGAIGMPKRIYDYICGVIEKPNGIFIVTGPTGSGKTTTLYACLNRINTSDSKLLTAEEPVEYEIEGIQQVPINEGIGLTFARALRAFLRQDPDRIMVGETRDLETAQIAIQASLTGHLVFTTLHTNDAPGAVARLIDMGVEPFLISSSLEAVLGQRLVRKICTSCRQPYEPSEAILRQIGLTIHDIGDKNFYYGAGCSECNNTGYKGRKGIYELLDITEPIRELITQRAPSQVIRQKAIEQGMSTLRADGLRSIFEGETTIEEVLKYT
ncbi:MAG TPA: ATPase, T2SS/T4P/T4SS family [Candidatus Methylacidiphilales bacterium]|jgi:type IV pilus assembly protein PilB|nr:ATPase, T2SS/T4P/T4SS family [Candidatus Methylacidiphilales bacterium]